MTFLSAVNPIFIVLPIVLAQYIYATFALVCLARARLSALSYALWNVFIVLIFFIGSTAFLIYNAQRKKKQSDTAKAVSEKPVGGGETKAPETEADTDSEKDNAPTGGKWDV